MIDLAIPSSASPTIHHLRIYLEARYPAEKLRAHNPTCVE
jgi:hypothetical protein